MTNTSPFICIHNLGGVGEKTTCLVWSRLRKKILLGMLDLTQELMGYLRWRKMIANKIYHEKKTIDSSNLLKEIYHTI